MSNLLRFLAAAALIGLGYGLAVLVQTAQQPVPPSRSAILQPDPPRGEADPQLVKALLEQDPLTRQRETIRVLQTLPADRLPSVLASLDRVALAPGDLELALVGEWLAQHDPPAAMRWAMSERWASHPWVVSAVLRAWARRDPQAAAGALMGIRNPTAVDAGMAALVLGWDEGGHPGLPEFMLGLEQGTSPQVAIEALVQRKLVREGPEATIRWAESLPDDDPAVVSRFKRNALRRVASALADWDPKAAMDWASMFGHTPLGRGAYRRVAIRTVLTDGEGTMQWLGTLPDGPQRDGALQESYRAWLGIDRAAAEAWILEHSDEDWIDPAHAMYAQVLVATQGPAAALDWVDRMSQGLRKRRTGQKLLRTWFLRDPDATRAWLENAPEWVTDSVKETALAPPRERPANVARRRARAAEQQESGADAGSTDDEPAGATAQP